ncbi:MAG TPA: choice-of-anchor tandem repeat GloVer-containing protein [Candidatus Acidoferrales bacterium]|nr:choice-of-anchor tandem repeat GloVer-containing protein [Candidatus Acidoferrales bacterium]
MPRTLFQGAWRVLAPLGIAALLLSLSVPALASTFNVVYNFAANPDGSAPVPQGALLQDALGNLYGELSSGGTFDLGANYGVSSNGVTFGILYNFGTASTDGAGPVAGLRNILFDANVTGLDYGVTESGGANGVGTVFLQNASGPFSTIYAFQGGTDGANPAGRLLPWFNGDYYGTTIAGGGLAEAGTIFRISGSGHYSVLHRFSGPDGENPWGGLQYGSDGNFYGTTLGGGADGNGAVYRVTPGGHVTVIYSFTGGNDGANPFGELATDFHGNLYGTTSSGGANGNGTIFRVNQWGHLTTLYSFPNDINGNPVNGAFPNSTLTLGIECSHSDFVRRASFGTLLSSHASVRPDNMSAGVTLYGVTPSGGADSSGVAFSFNVATSTYTILWNFTGGTDGADPNGKLLTSFDGNIYGVTAGGGSSGNGDVFAIGGVLQPGTLPLTQPARPVKHIH